MLQNDKREEKPSEGLLLTLPILAMLTLIGVLALLMRSAGKW